MSEFTYLADLFQEATPPADGILSRTVYADDRIKAVLFGFGVGQELSEHTASMPAIIHILDGEATITLGSERIEAKGGTWIHMPANLTHSVTAKTPTRMLLLLIKNVKA